MSETKQLIGQIDNTTEMYSFDLRDALVESLYKNFSDGFIDEAESIFGKYTFSNLDLNSTDIKILEDVPIIKTGIALMKTGFDIKNKLLLKKTIKFIKLFNNGALDINRVQKYKDKIMDKKKMERELEHIIIMLDSYLEIGKSMILGNLYISYLNEIIAWDRFVEFSYILEKIFVRDLDLLKMLIDNNGLYSQDIKNYSSLYRLISVGLVNKTDSFIRYINTINVISSCIEEPDYICNDTGVEFYNCGICDNIIEYKIR